MRSYTTARRRQVTKEPVLFAVDYVVDEPAEDPESGAPTAGLAVSAERREVFTCRGEINGLAISELVYSESVEVNTPEGISMLRGVFAGAFGDDAEYQRFLSFSMRHLLYNEDLLDILQGLVADFAARPTEQSSPSDGTPSTSADDSKVVSLPGGFQVECSTG